MRAAIKANKCKRLTSGKLILSIETTNDIPRKKKNLVNEIKNSKYRTFLNKKLFKDRKSQKMFNDRIKHLSVVIEHLYDTLFHSTAILTSENKTQKNCRMRLFILYFKTIWPIKHFFSLTTLVGNLYRNGKPIQKGR